MSTRPVLFVDPEVGRVFVPKEFLRSISLPGLPTRPAVRGEMGIFWAKQHRPIYNADGYLKRIELIWTDLFHNERVDAGADYQSKQVHGGGGTPGAPSATAYFNVIAVANASLTPAKGDQSLGSLTSGVTTNEFTTIGLSRAAASIIAGNYTAPGALGGQFTQVISKAFSVTGSGTAYGCGILNSTTVAGSILYVEANFTQGSTVVANGDTLTVQGSIQN